MSVVDVIRYFSNSANVTNLYKVKLMKLMWYADFLAYKLRGYAITGLVYQALPMGAVPIGHDSIIDLKGVNYEEIDMGDGTAYRFCRSEYSVEIDESAMKCKFKNSSKNAYRFLNSKTLSCNVVEAIVYYS